MLAWLKKKTGNATDAQFARAVAYALDWWMLCLVDTDHTFSGDQLVLDFAVRLRGEGRSIRNATCCLANLLAGDLVASQPAHVREPVLSFLDRPEVAATLAQLDPAQVAVGIDLYTGPNVGELAMTGGVRAGVLRTVLSRAGGEELEPAARSLFLGIRHLWERAIVAADADSDDAAVSYMAQRLVHECLYALEGHKSAARRLLHEEREGRRDSRPPQV